MRKSMSKRIIALVVGITVFSTGVLASAAITVGGDNTLTTGVDIENPIYSVIVPTGTDKVAIDALQMKTAGESIVSANYGFVNKSSVPVRVTISAKVTDATSGTDLIFTAKDDVNVTDLTNTDKEIYIAAIVPKKAAEDVITAPTKVVPDATDGYDATNADSVISLSATASTIDFLLNSSTYSAAVPAVLAKAEVTTAIEDDPATVEDETVPVSAAVDAEDAVPAAFTTLPADGEGVCVFKFTGKLNPNAAWESTDFTIDTTYKLQGVSTAAYADVIADVDKKVIGAHQLIDLTAPVVVAPTPGFTNAIVSITGNVDAVNELVLDDGYAISKVEVLFSDSNYYEIPTGQYTYASTTLTVLKDATVADFFIPSAYSTGYEIKVTATKSLSADKIYTYTLKTAE